MCIVIENISFFVFVLILMAAISQFLKGVQAHWKSGFAHRRLKYRFVFMFASGMFASPTRVCMKSCNLCIPDGHNQRLVSNNQILLNVILHLKPCFNLQAKMVMASEKNNIFSNHLNASQYDVSLVVCSQTRVTLTLTSGRL